MFEYNESYRITEQPKLSKDFFEFKTGEKKEEKEESKPEKLKNIKL